VSALLAFNPGGELGQLLVLALALPLLLAGAALGWVWGRLGRWIASDRH
jgi:hypothetical protein